MLITCNDPHPSTNHSTFFVNFPSAFSVVLTGKIRYVSAKHENHVHNHKGSHCIQPRFYQKQRFLHYYARK